jgi:hypothetical protein
MRGAFPLIQAKEKIIMTAKAPLNSARPFRMVAGLSRVEDLANGAQALGLGVGARTVFYCDGNAGNDGNSGQGGWENSFKTLTVALAASNADIAKDAYGWAARNVIYCRGDAFDEDLVLLAQKTDVVGVGSYNAKAKCALIGNHVPTGTTCSYGTRFFNFHFIANAAGGDIWTLDSTVSDLEFHNCTFYAGSTTAATAAIVDTAAPFLGLYNNEFIGRFSDATIEFGTGDGFRGTRIVGNYIEGANNGIELASGTTASSGASLLDGYIDKNIIHVAALTIDDNADIAFCTNNMLFSDATGGTALAVAIDVNVARCANNYLVTSVLNQLYPPNDVSS